jgi:hypothetical protein
MKPDWTDTPWRPWHTCLIGAAHRRELKNCQDATCIREGSRMRARTMVASGRYVVGVVSDGVGSHRYSEVGARVTATLAANLATDAMMRGEGPTALEARLTKQLPARLAELADLCRDEWTECCFATLVLAVGTIDWFAVWACGDGYCSVNGAVPSVTGVTARDRLPVDYRHPIDTARPPMLARLVELPAREVRGAWISTDGARYLTADGKPWRDYLGAPLADAPPVLEGWQEMESWGQALYDAARAGNSRLQDDLGLVAFVPREDA